MARPPKCRRICMMPTTQAFRPAGQSEEDCEVVELALDEYETLRLIDYLGYNQEDCAGQMKVARSTVQAVYNDARKKLAKALIEGKPFVIKGGHYELCEQSGVCCGKNCSDKGCRKRFCEQNKNDEEDGGKCCENCSNV